MHRHGYKGRKFHRGADQREALIKGLADSLVRDESIVTTLMKAKEVVPYTEKLITKAKKGDLHSRRQVIAGLQTVASAHKLVDELAPKLSSRDSGHLRIERTTIRRGDNTQMARVSFVEFDVPKAKVATAPAKVVEQKPAKPATEKPTSTTKPTAKKPESKPTSVKKVAR